MWKFVRPQLACQAYLSKAVWPLSYICTKSTSLNCSSGEPDTAALKTICFNLDITGTSHNAYSHLPFKLSHCKGRTGPTLYLKHNFLVCTTTGSTKANLVLCTSGTSSNHLQTQPACTRRNLRGLVNVLFISGTRETTYTVDTSNLVNF